MKIRTMDVSGRLFGARSVSSCERLVERRMAVYGVVDWRGSDQSLTRPVRVCLNREDPGPLSMCEELVLIHCPDLGMCWDVVLRHWERRDWLGRIPPAMVAQVVEKRHLEVPSIATLCHDLQWWARTGHARSEEVLRVGLCLEKAYKAMTARRDARLAAAAAAGGGMVSIDGNRTISGAGRRMETGEVQALAAARGQ